LGRAAAVVGNEMHDLLGALKKLSQKSSRLECTELDGDFANEMMRLERMIQVSGARGEGATFIMIIPRDKTSTTLTEDAISAATRLNSES
jgi:hypothetical protein